MMRQISLDESVVVELGYQHIDQISVIE
jgi:hypothetical protein